MAKFNKPNNIKAKEIRIKQINWLLENLKEPVFVDLSASNASLSNTFGLEETNEYNPSAITYRILNYRLYKDVGVKYASIANFMRSIQEYLPKEIKTTKMLLWHKSSYDADALPNVTPEMLEAMDRAVEWFENFKMKIEDKLTNQLYMAGDHKNQYLEILKRRFRDNWSERIENKVEANVEADVDKTIHITFEDA